MNILFCVPEKITTRLGAPKVYVELAKALERQGKQCTLVGINEVAPGIGQYDRKIDRNAYYAQCLKTYIHENAAAYDVIEYEHQFLPFSREELPAEVLLVARSVLLIHNARDIPLPLLKGIPLLLRNVYRDLLSGSLKSGRESVGLTQYMNVLKKHVGTKWRYLTSSEYVGQLADAATKTCKEADLVMISNSPDANTLVKQGVDSQKIEVLPYGMSPERYDSFEISGVERSTDTVVFVGTFDFRKGGATDLPRITEYINHIFPQVKFLLLGTNGLFTSKDEVISHFAPSIRKNLKIIPKYAPENLPNLLEEANIGIFPSYYEGFPFSVLEMLAASIPVISYNTAGPSEMLDSECLARRGDWKGIAEKVTLLLNNQRKLTELSSKARDSVKKFDWNKIACKTIKIYSKNSS